MTLFFLSYSYTKSGEDCSCLVFLGLFLLRPRCQYNLRLLRFTRRLNHVFLLAVAVAADVVEGEKEVMLVVQLSRQLQLDLTGGSTGAERRGVGGLMSGAECGATPWRIQTELQKICVLPIGWMEMWVESLRGHLFIPCLDKRDEPEVSSD